MLSFDVNRRTRELGIRGALGASSPAVARLVLGEALRVAAAGLAIGIPASLAATRLLETLLFGTSRTDPAVYIAVVLGIAAVSTCATYIPARRAARVSPMVALRAD